MQQALSWLISSSALIRILNSFKLYEKEKKNQSFLLELTRELLFVSSQ
jgi:hypothetical protein